MSPPPKRANRYHQHRSQKYRGEWETLKEFAGWLTKSEESETNAMCRCCNVQLLAERTVLKRHGESSAHKLKAATIKTNRTLNQMLLKNTAELSFQKKVQSAEISLSGFFAEHHLSFRVIDELLPTLQIIFDDSKIASAMKLGRTKLTNILKNVIAKSEKADLVEDLKNTPFSILADESTDVSTLKVMAIVVRYFSKIEKKVVSKLWALAQIYSPSSSTSSTSNSPHNSVDILDNDEEIFEAEAELPSVNVINAATAEELFNLLRKSFTDFNIPEKNIIGFACDGANVMLGEHNSVGSRFIQNYPGIYVLKCICHSLHLCASEACKRLPRHAEDLSRNIYAFFKLSSKRKSEFREFQVFLDLPLHKILHRSQTRWLSAGHVNDRILEQWSALEAYFEAKAKTEKLVIVESILQSLKDPLIKLIFYFLSWILAKFNKLNSYFQSNGSVLADVHDQMNSFFREILTAYLDNRYVNQNDLSTIDVQNESKFSVDSQMYVGATVFKQMLPFSGPKHDLLRKHFHSYVRQFLITAALEIRKRFNLNDPVMKCVSIFSSRKCRSIELRQTYPTLMSVMELVPRISAIFTDTEKQLIDDEWRNLPFTDIPENVLSLKTEEFWVALLELKDSVDRFPFKNLAKFALYLISLPHSNADTERIFSQMNLTKTKERNRLIVETVQGSMMSSQRIKRSGGSTSFVPNEDMLKRMTTLNLYPVNPDRKA